MCYAECVRPAPVLTEDNHEFWEAARDGRLVAQGCSSCGRLRHPPRPACPHCRSLDHDLVELGGRGVVYSYALLHHPQNPLFDYPVVAALVDLAEGVRLVTNLVDVQPADVRIGLPVTVTFVPTAGGMAVPVFRPEPEEAP
jgi:uncharacterized OB-fold protein